MTILIAADSLSLRKSFLKLFEDMGHKPDEMIEADDAGEAMQKLQAVKYAVDLIIADLNMPGMEEHAFLKKFNRETGNREVPVILCINATQRADGAEALRHGATDILERPFSVTAFTEKLREIKIRVLAKQSRETKAFLKTIVMAAEVETGLPFLMRLPSAIMKDLLQLSIRATHEAGVELLKAGSLVEALHIITLGEVELLEKEGGAVEVRPIGECFGEIAFLSGDPSPHAARTRTWSQVVSLPRDRLAELLRRQPEMTRHLSALMARGTKARDKVPVRGGSDFAGNLSSMVFTDVLQLLQLGRKTGALSLTRAGASGRIVLENGEVCQASAGELVGEEAFHALASWNNATFSFDAMAVTGPRNITQPTMTLLMEAMRRLDEGKRA
jgi:CheY-like chemotaxis protein